MPDIAFVTCRRWPDLSTDDRLVAASLEARGCRVVAAAWNDAEVDWASCDLETLRSCWEYHLAPAGFRDWLGGLEAHGARVVNPVHTLRWNMDNGYLCDLAERGVFVPDTVFSDDGTSLADVMDTQGWSCGVVKPKTSAMAHGTVKVFREDAGAFQSHLESLIGASGAIVQENVTAVELAGETSLIFSAGEFSHAVLKRPAPGEFRVQSHHGGTVYRADPDAALIAQAGDVLEQVPLDWSYARVDGCVVGRRLALMELELIGPALFLECNTLPRDRFAEALLGRLE